MENNYIAADERGCGLDCQAGIEMPDLKDQIMINSMNITIEHLDISRQIKDDRPMIDNKMQDTPNTKAMDVEMQSETLVHNNHIKEVNCTSSVSIKLSSDVDASKSKQLFAHPLRKSAYRPFANPSTNTFSLYLLLFENHPHTHPYNRHLQAAR